MIFAFICKPCYNNISTLKGGAENEDLCKGPHRSFTGHIGNMAIKTVLGRSNLAHHRQSWRNCDYGYINRRNHSWDFAHMSKIPRNKSTSSQDVLLF